MARNKKLAEIVLGQMYDFLQDKDLMLMNEDKESGAEMILSLGRVDIDEETKFRIIRGSMLGYGYDFNGEVDDESSKEMFEMAVKTTKEYSGRPNFETFIDSGIIEDRYGWYLTSL
jgi:hypothetical protein